MSASPRVVLLTGATGFVGKVVLEALLAPPRGARHRARHRAGARGGPGARRRALPRRRRQPRACFAAHAPGWEKRVEALPGDVTQPGLGLSREALRARRWRRSRTSSTARRRSSSPCRSPRRSPSTRAARCTRSSSRAPARARVVRRRLDGLRHAAPGSVRRAACAAWRSGWRRCRASRKRSTPRSSRARGARGEERALLARDAPPEHLHADQVPGRASRGAPRAARCP